MKSLADRIKLAMSVPVTVPIHESRMATLEKQGVALDEYWAPSDNRYLCELKEPTTDEDKKLVDGKTVLGVFEGCFFVPDGFSRNKRFYSKELWEKALNSKSLKERLESRKLFGALGHEDKPLDEKDIAQGKHAFNIVKLWIDESTGLGMGKALIMNTESGWNMFCAMKTGAKFQMSSRAKGGFKEGVTKIDENGIKQPVVDPDTYNVFNWDAVLDPGFLETSAVLQESKNNNDNKEKGEMNLEEMLKQKDSALNEALTNLTSQNEEIRVLKADKEQLSESLKEFTFLKDMDRSMLEHIKTFSKDDWNSIFEGKVQTAGAPREVSYQDGQIGYDAVFIPTSSALISESRIKAGMYQADFNESAPVKVALVNKSVNPVYGSDGIILAWNVGNRPNGASSLINESFVQKADALFENVNPNADYIQELEEKLAMYENTPDETAKLVEACENAKYALEKYTSLGSYTSVKEALEIAVDTLEKLESFGGIGSVTSKLNEVSEIEAQVGPLNQLVPELEAIEETFLEIQDLGGSIPNIRKALEVSEKKLQEVLDARGKEKAKEMENYAHEYSQKCGISEQEALDIIESFGGDVEQAESKVFKLMENRSSYRPAPRRKETPRTRKVDENLNEDHRQEQAPLNENKTALVSGFYKSMRKGNLGR
jgi:hypothetical protein